MWTWEWNCLISYYWPSLIIFLSSLIQQRIRNLYVQLENGRHWRKYLTSKLCNLMKNKYCIFKITVCVLVLSVWYKTVSKHLESINTVVYSWKRSQGQHSWKTLKILFNFATSSHYDTFYLYNAAKKKAHVPVKFVKFVSEMLSFHIVKLIQNHILFL